ncbi:MAG: hypothetical protein LBD48_06410 [Treponema sp.]|jgi:hypothetical protein|nr:hypothetical protein [Treponema sp.]
MKKTLFLSMALCCAALIFAEDVAMPRLAIPTARSNGMGGTHVAYTDNVFALLVNPAAMMRVEQRSFFALSPTLFSPQSTFGLINAINSIVSNGDLGALGEATDLLSRSKGKISLGFDIREFPLSIAWVADGFGFGLWNRVFVNPNIIGTNFNFDVYADVMLPVGFAFKILDMNGHAIDAGVTVKPFARVRAHENIDLMEFAEEDADPIGSISVPLIFGAGFDLGLLYRWDIGLSAGITFDDIVTRGVVAGNLYGSRNDTNSYFVPFSMNAGLAYDLKLGRFWESAPGFLAKTGVSFAVDWRDITNLFQQTDYTKRNALLDLGLGLEFSLAELLKLRVGLNEMLPAVGAGFDLGPVEIDAAYYGKELGLEPGQLPVAALDLTFALRPGAKKRNWPWTRHSLVGLISGSEKTANTEY